MISLYNRTSYQTTIPLFYRPYPCGQPLIDFLLWGGPFTEPLTTVRVAVLWWRRHSFCHVRLGVNFMSWSNFCVLVWLSLPWRDFITLSDIIRTCGHVMDDVITLWWSRESWYDFSPSWTKFFVLVRFCLSWCHFIPWCDQPNLGMIFLRFGYNFRFSEIIFLLVLFHILVRSTASWYDFPSFCYALSSKCDFVWFGVILYLGAINCILVWSLCFGYWYFLYISFLFLH